MRALKRQLLRDCQDGRSLAPGAPRLAALRKELAKRGLAGFLVPRADEHQGEYVPPRAERLAWLTGFTGSAGLAIVLADKAAIFVDGRYTLQVRNQTDTSLFEPRHSTEQPPEDWIKANLPKGGKIGYDPWLHTPTGLKHLRKAVTAAGGELVALESNPLDAVWTRSAAGADRARRWRSICALPAAARRTSAKALARCWPARRSTPRFSPGRIPSPGC